MSPASQAPLETLQPGRRDKPAERGTFTVSRRKRHWQVVDPAGELVCLTAYKRGANEVARRLATLKPFHQSGGTMPFDLLLAELKAPCTLEGLSDVLGRVEEKFRTASSSFWETKGMKAYDDTYAMVLLARLKFLLLACGAQQAIIHPHAETDQKEEKVA